MGEPEGKRPFGIPRSRREDKYENRSSKVGWGGMDWIDLAQDRDRWRDHANATMNLRVPYNVLEFLAS